MISSAYGPSAALAPCMMDAGSLQQRVIVLAMKSGPVAAAATRVAAALVASRGAKPIVIRAYFAAPAFARTPIPATMWVDSAVAATRNGVRHELTCASSEAEKWPILVVGGAPSEVIAATAREVGAAMIVMGLHARSGLRRVTGAETALRVLRQTAIPVLAITPALNALPRRIVVAVDFSRAGLRAARAALSLLADGGSLDLAFIDKLPSPTTEDSEGDAASHAHGVDVAFARLREQLAAPIQVTVSTTVLSGRPGEALLAYAERIDAEVIAVGSGRHGMLDRILAGSVTVDLVHVARRSLLIVPPHGL